MGTNTSAQGYFDPNQANKNVQPQTDEKTPQQKDFTEKDIKYFTNDLILRIIEHIQSSTIVAMDSQVESMLQAGAQIGNLQADSQIGTQIVAVGLTSGQQESFRTQVILEHIPPSQLIPQQDQDQDQEYNDLTQNQPELTKEVLEQIFEHYLINQPKHVTYTNKFDRQRINTIIGFEHDDSAKAFTHSQLGDFKVLFVKFMVRAELYMIYKHIHPIYQMQDIAKKIYRHNSIDRIQINENFKMAINIKDCFKQLCQNLITFIKNQYIPPLQQGEQQIDIEGDCDLRIRLRVYNKDDIALLDSGKTIITYLQQCKQNEQIQNSLYFITNFSKEQNTQQLNIIFDKLIFEITIGVDILDLYTEISQVIDLTQICLILHTRRIDQEIDLMMTQRK